MNTLTTDFYSDFACKCGKCRHACCIGWPVNVTMPEYFRLIGIECSEDLRHRLDCGMILRGGGQQEYAYIHHGYTGDCYMRRDDGLCAIQRELGEEVLPDICRLYPRSSTLWDDGAKCAVANSCEETVELLLHRKEPIKFTENDIDLPRISKSGSRSSSLEYAYALQDRSLPLNERIAKIAGCKISGNKKAAYDSAMLLLSLGEHSKNAALICNKAKEALNNSDILFAYDPNAELLFEQLIVNHVFFTSFEKSYSPSLAAVYLLVKSVYVGNKHDTDEQAADILSEVFRFIEHSPFLSVTDELAAKNGLNITDILSI